MSGSLSVAASRPLVKHPDESLLFGVDFRRLLEAWELLTGVPTVVATPAGLQISQPAINGSSVVDDAGGLIPAGNLVQLRIAGGAPGGDYTLTITSGTSQGNVRAGVCALQVRVT